LSREARSVLAVDIGSTRVAALVADVSGREPAITGLGLARCTGLRKGVVVDIEGTAQAVSAAVGEACAAAGVKLKSAYVSISGSHIQSFTGEAEMAIARPDQGIAPEDVKTLLEKATAVGMPPDRELIHVVPRQFQVDGVDGVRDPVGMVGRRLAVTGHLLTGHDGAIQNVLRSVVRADLTVADYLVAVRAAGEAVLTREDREAGVLLLDIGGGTTSVAVYDNGHLWHVAVVPIGGEHITSDVSVGLRLPVPQAEQVKVERGWALRDLASQERYEVPGPSGLDKREVSEKLLAEVIESRVRELLRLAAREVKLSGYSGLFPGGIVVTGGTAELKGIAQATADYFDLPARVGAPLGFTGPVQISSAPGLAVAAGLIRWGSRLTVVEEAAPAAEAEPKEALWGRVRKWMAGLVR
jgi:cell division protein FtsA